MDKKNKIRFCQIMKNKCIEDKCAWYNELRKGWPWKLFRAFFFIYGLYIFYNGIHPLRIKPFNFIDNLCPIIILIMGALLLWLAICFKTIL